MFKRILSTILLIHLFTLPVVAISCAKPNYKIYEQEFNNYIIDEFKKLDEVYYSNQEVMDSFINFSTSFYKFEVGLFNNNCNELIPINCIDDKFYSNIEVGETIDRYSKRFLLKFYRLENYHFQNITFGEPSIVVNFGHKFEQDLLKENQFYVSYGNELKINVNNSSDYFDFKISTNPFDNFNNLIDNQSMKTSVTEDGLISIFPKRGWNDLAERKKMEFYLSVTSIYGTKKYGMDFNVFLTGEIKTIELDETTPLAESYPPEKWIKFKIKDPYNQINLSVNDSDYFISRINQEQKTVEIKFNIIQSAKILFSINDDNFLYNQLNLEVNVFVLEYSLVQINNDFINIDDSQSFSNLSIKDFKVNSNFLYEGRMKIHHNSLKALEFNQEIDLENYKIVLKPLSLETYYSEYTIYFYKKSLLRGVEILVGDTLTFEMKPKNNYFNGFWLNLKFI